MSLSFLLAWRFLMGSQEEKSITIMIKICFCSILISTFALTLVAAIMNGYEKATHNKLKGIHADVIISANGKSIDFEKVNNVLQKELSATIDASSPIALSQALIQGKNDTTPLCALRAINPDLEQKVSTLKETLLDTSSWQKLSEPHTILLGKRLAEQLEVTIGDTISLLYGEDIINNKVTLNKQEVEVIGLFSTGIHEFDEFVSIISLATYNELFPNGITQINVKLKEYSQEKASLDKLKQRLPLTVMSWKELYPALVSALTLEKYAMIIILALVTLIASMNILSLLFMLVTQKQGTIALLKSMGIGAGPLLSIFILIGLIISFSATFFGIIFAVLACFILERYHFIKLPDIYYVAHIPTHLDYNLIFMVIVLIFCLTLLATLAPLYKIKRITIARMLRDRLA